MAASRPRVFTNKEATSPIDYEPVAPAQFRDEMPVLGAEPPKAVEEVTLVHLQIPTTIYNEYKRLASAQDMTVEELLQHRVKACKSHNAVKGLWFSDSERGQLENLLQKWPLETAAQALGLISRAATVTFDNVTVTLSPAQKKVLSIAMFGGRTPQTFFESLIRKELRV